MYVVRHHLTVPRDQQAGLLAEVETTHAGLRSTPGFRWAMVLRSTNDPAQMAAVAMWLKREDAGNAGFPVTHYDVATARGSMTPATAAALVDWQVDAPVAAAFTNRWNAAYHAIEDSIGSRLLQDMDDAAHYTGLHVAISEAALKLDVLSAGIKDDAGAEHKPQTVQRFEVVSLVEA
jgi:heme-degrading monooxygenase HmoA